MGASDNPTPHNPDLIDESYVDATLGDSRALGAEEQKVLGVLWRPRDDCFLFDVSAVFHLASMSRPTKRNVISIVGRFYDPLGFLAPVTIRFKILDGLISPQFLYGFCDASTRAYAAVVYLVTMTEVDTHVSFVAAKTRVAPL